MIMLTFAIYLIVQSIQYIDVTFCARRAAQRLYLGDLIPESCHARQAFLKFDTFMISTFFDDLNNLSN